MDAQYDSIPKNVAVAHEGFSMYVVLAMVGRRWLADTERNAQCFMKTMMQIFKYAMLFRLILEIIGLYASATGSNKRK